MKSAFPTLALLALTAVLAGGCAAVDSERSAQDPKARPEPKYRGQFTLAGGKYKHDIEDASEDDTTAGLVAAQGEICSPEGIGGGLTVEFLSSNDHLLAGQTSTSHAEAVDVFPHLLYRASAGETLRMPVRLGPWMHALTLEDEGSTDRLRWRTLGLRLAVEPEIVIERTENFEWSFFTSVALAAGATRIELDSAANDDEFDSYAAALSLEVGPRFRWSHVFAGISFLHRAVAFDESDPANSQTVSELHSTFSGFAVTLGGGF